MADPSLFDEPAHLALKLASVDLDEARRHARPWEMSHALATVARSYRRLHALPSAEACGEMALRWSRLTGSTDLEVDILCELSETAAELGDHLEEERPGGGHAAQERARDHVFKAAMLAGRVADPTWEFKVLLRISEVLERCGDRDDAALLQTRALRLMSGDLPAGPPDPCLLPSIGRLADS